MRATFRVSEVESFRQYRDDPDAEVGKLLERMRGQSEASEAMIVGTAFHKALELSPVGVEATAISALGYTFPFAGDFEIGLTTIREIRANKVYTGPDFALTISGQLDAIHGKRVEDHKTTARFDADRYMAGYQWRLYLDIFGADVFRWNVFEIAMTDDPMTWEVNNAHRLEQYRYPGMTQDCERLVADLAAFTRTHLPERVKTLEPA